MLGVQESGGAQRRGAEELTVETTGFGMDWSGQGAVQETWAQAESVIVATVLGDMEGKLGVRQPELLCRVWGLSNWKQGLGLGWVPAAHRSEAFPGSFFLEGAG